MPNRILRPWVDSEAVNSLSDAGEVFFVRLIQVADDFGRFHGSAQLLKSYLYPLKDKRVSDISRLIAECVKAGLIAVYEVSGKRYVQIRKFNQRVRMAVSKFPEEKEGFPENDSHVTVTCQTHDRHMTARDGDGDEDGDEGAETRGRAHSREGDGGTSAAIASKLYWAYPKKVAMTDGMLAAKRVIDAEFDKGAEYPEIETRMMEAVRLYSAAVKTWKFNRRKYIWNMKTFFDAGHYADDPECWKEYSESEEPPEEKRDDWVELPDGSRARRSVL